MELTDAPHHLLLRVLNFLVAILETKKLYYMERLPYKFDHVTWLIHSFKCPVLSYLT